MPSIALFFILPKDELCQVQTFGQIEINSLASFPFSLNFGFFYCLLLLLEHPKPRFL